MVHPNSATPRDNLFPYQTATIKPRASRLSCEAFYHLTVLFDVACNMPSCYLYLGDTFVFSLKIMHAPSRVSHWFAVNVFQGLRGTPGKTEALELSHRY